MRSYATSDEETLRVRRYLNDWAGEGLLSDARYQAMEQEAECGLRRTNGFLRLVLFVFTMISASAAAWLFFVTFFQGQLAGNSREQGIFLLVIAALVYAGAEVCVSGARLYRHGIEEALAVLSVLFLCAGLLGVLGRDFTSQGSSASLVPAAGAIVSFWIYRRFGFLYAFVAAMIFVAFLPQYGTASHTGQRLILAIIYTAGLATVALVRTAHRFDYLDEEYSLVEALLWLGLYLTFNLRLSSLSLLADLGNQPSASTAESAGAFYWTTYALIWCLPAVLLWRALRMKDRWLLGLGMVIALLTLITNKAYLRWPIHPWDPMFLGVLLAGVAIVVRRWLAKVPSGVRGGFTARRLSGRDKEWMSNLSSVSSVVSPGPAAGPAEPSFGGGSSGGGGASSNF